MVTALTVEAVLTDRFGLANLREKQKEVIGNVLSGKHCLALLPTGYGKSLCYQLPSQILSGITLVVSPLIALMQDQLSGLLKRGIDNATVINSSVSSEELEERYQGIRSGRYKLIYVAPERLDTPRFKALLQHLNVSLFVIDEAHCISQWGHDFRPQYRHMRRYLEMIPETTVLAVTATATPRVRDDIIHSLNLDDMKIVQGDFDRPNLRLEVEQCTNNADKDRHLFRALGESNQSAIVYVSSRKEAEALTGRLKVSKIKAACYHAGLPAEERKRAQRRFEEDEVQAIVSTVAFGMGVDKATIRKVIHYNLPPSLENYYQEAGRAGRDGRDAVCTLLYQAKDIYTQRWLMQQNYPTEKQIHDVLACLKAGNPMRAYEIRDQVDMSDSALNSTIDLFNQLELVILTSEGARLKEGNKTLTYVNTAPMKARRDRDAARLDMMVNYATGIKCRRQYILGYFGQTIENTCSGCDICAPKPKYDELVETLKFTNKPKGTSAKKQSLSYQSGEPLRKAIYNLTKDLSGKVGRTTIANILSGSKAKKLIEKDFHKLPAYGSFAHKRAESILSEIDALVEDGHLRVIPGMYPKLVVARALN